MTDPRSLWATDAWRADAVAWVDRHLAGHGLERTADVAQPHLMPWATVLSIPTTSGTVWMKAAGPGTAFEVGLYELLHRVAPDRALPPLAVHTDAGWLLLPDGGPVVRDQLAGPDLADALVEVAPQYAQLQIDLAPHLADLLALGVADMRAERMASRFDEAVAAVGSYAEERATDEEREGYERVIALRDDFASWCDRLVGAPGLASLDHNDLHGGNIFVTGGPGARQSRYFDWGDSVVSHPFASLLVLKAVVHHVLEVSPRDPAVQRVVDAYLEPFTSLASRAELLETVDLACEIGKVARSLVWGRAVSLLAPGEDDEDASAPFRWLLELLEGPLAARGSRSGEPLGGGVDLGLSPMAEERETKSVIVTSEVHDYLLAHGTPPDAVQEALIAATSTLGGVSRMQIAPEQGALMTLLTTLVGARFAVEVGTFTGYSSICIARGLAPGGKLLCCDVSEEWTAIARDHWAQAGVADRIELVIGPAADTLRALSRDPAIDLAFIDADKTGYRTYYDEIVDRLRPGGLVMLDNVLWSGRVVDGTDQSEDTVALRSVNDHIASDPRVEVIMLPIADGLTIAHKR